MRNPKGEIEVREQPLNAALYRGRAARLPFVRGLVMLWDALVLARALLWSSDGRRRKKRSIDGERRWPGLVVVR